MSRLARAAVTVIVVGAAGAGQAYAAPQEGALPTAAPVDITVDAAVVGQFPAFAMPTSRTSVLVTVGAPLSDLAKVSATLSVTNAPLVTATAIDEFVNDPAAVASRAVADAVVTASSSTPLPPGTVPVGSSATVALSVEPGALGLPTDQWGVYGLIVAVDIGGERVWSQASPLTWQPQLVPPLDVAVIASVSGPPERVDSLLVAAGDPRVTLLVDPSALTARQRLSLDRREAYALPAGNLDVTSVAHASVPALLDAALAESRRYSPLPWLAVAASADDATVGLASAAGAAAIVADARWAGVDSQGAAVVTATPVDNRAFAPVMVPDAELSLTLASQSPAQPASTARVLAVAALRAGNGGGSVVVAPGDGWIVDGTRSSRAVETLLDAPFVTSRPLTTVLSASDRPSIDLPDSTPSTADASSDQVLDAVAALDRLSVMANATADASAMVDAARGAVLGAMSLPDRADPDRRLAEFGDALEQANTVTSAVSVTSGTTLNLVSSSGDVPVTVRNDLDVPITVRVAMMSRSPILVPQAQPTATVEAGTESTVLVPVTAVSNGDVKVTVALRNEEGQTVTVAETLRVKVRAQWGNATTGLFTVGLVVLLIVGVIRTARRGRKDTRVRPADAGDVAGASDVDA